MYVIRVFCVLMLSLCASGANSSTIRDIDLKLSFDGHSYYDVTVTGVDGTPLFSGDRLDEADDEWGLPRLFYFALGETVSLTARLRGTDGISDPGEALTCILGERYDCGNADLVELGDDRFDLFYGATTWFRGVTVLGGLVLFDIYYPELTTDQRTQSDDIASWSVWRASFTVLENTPVPAPIPLPVPALLLPAGLGCLALLRGRRRSRIS